MPPTPIEIAIKRADEDLINRGLEGVEASQLILVGFGYLGKKLDALTACLEARKPAGTPPTNRTGTERVKAAGARYGPPSAAAAAVVAILEAILRNL